MKKLFWLFPVLFLIDTVMGCNGYQFTVFGIGIRILLFALSMVSLCLYCLLTVHQQNIALWKRQPDRPWFWDLIKPIDWFVLGFIVWNLFWAVVVPRITPGNPADGLNEFDPLLVLSLHFPCAFLLRTGQLKLRSVIKWFIPLAALLALWHSIMYLGETADPGFYMGYYDFIDKISFGTAVRTEVILGVGITRVIQTTSVLMIPGMLLLLQYATEKKRIWPYLLLVPMLFGVLVTYTKSIWFGILAGLAVAVLGFVICAKDSGAKKRAGAFLLVMTALFFLFNNGILHNTIITRTLNITTSAHIEKIDSQIADLQAQLDKLQAEATKPTDPTAPSEPVETLDVDKLTEQLELLEHQREDAANTALSQALREAQDAALLGKWQDSKWLGFGYGAYVEDCIRNVQFPFMYESLIPALLLKIGLVGLLGWGAFVAAMVYFAYKAMWKKPLRFWCWIGIGLAYAMAVQTNPFLFTFPGLSIMVYLSLSIVAEESYESDPAVHL